MEYSWTITPPVMIDLEGRPSLTVWDPGSTQVVVFPSFALPSDSMFMLTFTASAGLSSASVSVQVNVHRMPPKAKLEGGDRLISIAPTASPSYVLDASSSKSTTANRGALTYFWTCYQNVKIVDAVIGLQKFECALLASSATYQGSSQLHLDTEKLRKHAYTFSPDLRIPSYTTGCPEESPNFRCDPTVTYIFSVTVCDADLGTCTSNSRLSDSTRVEWSTTRLLVPEVFIAAQDTSRISAEFNVVCEGGVGGSKKPRYQWVQLGPVGSELLHDPVNLLAPITSCSLVMKPWLLSGADRYDSSLQTDIFQYFITCRLSTWLFLLHVCC